MGTITLCRILPICSFLLKFLFLVLIFAFGSNATDTITQDKVFRDGRVLTSAGGMFKFGFFSPPNSSYRYVGIWYSNTSVQTVVWVANRNTPISDRSGSLSVGSDGNLVVLDGQQTIVWSSNNTNSGSNYTGVLLEDGNFVIRSGSCNSIPGSYGVCWQSFDHPTDTYLPGMRVYFNQNKGEVRSFSSWKSESDPSTGKYSMGVDPRAAPQIVIWEGSKRVWRSGFFTGMLFIGVPSMTVFYSSGFKTSNVDPQGNLYFIYAPSNQSYTSFRFRITWDGFEKSLFTYQGGTDWNMLQMEPATPCDVYNKCGPYGHCSTSNAGKPVCGCFRGFKPKYQDQWDNGNWSAGCVRKTSLTCDKNNTLISQDKFLEIHHVKLPDFAHLVDGAGDAQSCQKQCLNTCSCMAYAYVTGIGCLTWADGLIDIQRFPTAGDTLLLRLSPSDFDSRDALSSPKIAAIVLSTVLVLGMMLFFLVRFGSQLRGLLSKRDDNQLTNQLRKSQVYSTDIPIPLEMSGDENLVKAPELPMFDYNVVASATNMFSEDNKLGEGGFGPVYKGILPGGQEIAVKKLSRISGQGMEEFKNEIVLIAKLQHRNLVRILGFCMEGDEKMLIYEYMPKKSLDGILFDPVKRGQLDWTKRCTIIEGVARGLLYLHRDARCKIIHRDLKASNILLDQDMKPKISDFGVARMFGGDEEHMNTNRVVGTYGYMSPEYAMQGFFSERSDVYSFGVLLLEIITGRRNISFHSSEYVSLVEYTWQLWRERKPAELIDPSISDSPPTDQVSRYVHIAMLCVQDFAVDRPVMSQVVLWLESDSVALPNPVPKAPTLTFSSFKGYIEDSINEIHDNGSLTMSTMVPR